MKGRDRTGFASFFKFDRRRSSAVAGQAMVEFAILLPVLLIICLGMLYTSRLLTFDYWAGQEARFIAYEQTWSAREYYGSYDEAITKLNDTHFFHRPPVVDQLIQQKNGNDDGSLKSLLTKNDHLSFSPGGADPVLLAGAEHSIWNSRFKDWVRDKSREYSFVHEALASQNMAPATRDTEGYPSEVPPRIVKGRTELPREYQQLADGFTELLERGGFGPRFCARLDLVFKKHNLARLTDADCGTRVSRSFGEFIARDVDFGEVFRDFGYQLSATEDSGSALQSTLEKAAAREFYSFFQTTIKNAANGAPNVINDFKLDNETGAVSAAEFQRVLSEARYAGSTSAIDTIKSNMSLVASHATSGTRDWQAEKTFEDSVNKVLHADASSVGSYSFPNTYLPLPLTFRPVFGSLYDAIMLNVLDFDSSSVQSALVTDSNRSVEVRLRAAEGLSLPIRKRWQTQGRELRARYYLITEPWHITRRLSATAGWRGLGGQDDSVDDNTEEGVLRRRVSGLFLIPSNMKDMFASVLGIVPGLETAADVFAPVDALISTVKKFLLDNPLIDFSYTLQDLPVLDTIDFTFPRWPAVRPQAYPGSTEMKDDHLAIGAGRTFHDYIQEQKDNNPEAKPTFH